MSASPRDLYQRACELGLRLKTKGDKLAVSPVDRAPADFIDLLRENKPALLKWLSGPPCPGWRAVPPSDLPLNASRPRLSPHGARRVMDFVVRQITGTDDMCEWCLKRELAYWNSYHWSDAQCALAAARDVACYQLNCNEANALVTLEAFEQLNMNHQ